MIKLGVGVLRLRRRIEGRGFRLHVYGMIGRLQRFWGEGNYSEMFFVSRWE